MNFNTAYWNRKTFRHELLYWCFLLFFTCDSLRNALFSNCSAFHFLSLSFFFKISLLCFRGDLPHPKSNCAYHSPHNYLVTAWLPIIFCIKSILKPVDAPSSNWFSLFQKTSWHPQFNFWWNYTAWNYSLINFIKYYYPFKLFH